MPTVYDGHAQPIQIALNANSSNPELTTSLNDNQVDLTIPVIVETDIIIRGYVNLNYIIIDNLMQ
jgi:hypothetical protein